MRHRGYKETCNYWMLPKYLKNTFSKGHKKNGIIWSNRTHKPSDLQGDIEARYNNLLKELGGLIKLEALITQNAEVQLAKFGNDSYALFVPSMGACAFELE